MFIMLSVSQIVTARTVHPTAPPLATASLARSRVPPPARTTSASLTTIVMWSPKQSSACMEGGAVITLTGFVVSTHVSFIFM
jgi:hypothetical protein